ncbi:MAG TPA: SufD family Fe-S cluster assembly protein [Sulfuricurvum sp.]|nr:SufD family Fe-S cluster assembly protein [Sulfuricurvum sp.]
MSSYNKPTLQAMKNVAYNLGEEKSATFFARDTKILDAHSSTSAVEILPISVALKKYPWLRELSYSLVRSDQDEYVAQVARDSANLGYFIRVRAGEKVILPVNTCYLIDANRFTQCTHNIVIAEEGSEFHLISGCASNAHIESGRHIGVSEFFIGKNAVVTSTMVHSWGKEVEVFPRTAVHIEKNGKFVSSYVALGNVKSVQMDPIAIIEEGGLGEFYSVIYAPEGSVFDVGSTALLNGEGASTQMVSRVVSAGGHVLTRGKIIGEKSGGRGTMACNGLLLSDKGFIHAIPELVGKNPNLELSHEASVGMISKEELAYLMASGIDEERAKSLIIEGFLDLHIPSLPEYLQRQINTLVQETKFSDTL